MSEKNPIDLNPGDSAVIVRHDNSDDAGFGIEIYHHPLKSMSDEDLIFYTLLTRGMAFQATICYMDFVIHLERLSHPC